MVRQGKTTQEIAEALGTKTEKQVEKRRGQVLYRYKLEDANS